MKKLSLIVLVALLATAAPARAANVTVLFSLSAGAPAETGVLCPVTVPANADGVVVLEAAKRRLCIESYTVEHTSLGRLITCINRVCGAPQEAMWATYWAMSVNGAYTDYGVDGFRAENGKELGFTYTSWLTCLTPLGC